MDIHSKLLNFVLYWGTKGSQEMEDKFKQIRNSLMRHSVSSELFDDIYSNIALTLENYDFKDKELCINDLNDLFRIIKLNKMNILGILQFSMLLLNQSMVVH